MVIIGSRVALGLSLVGTFTTCTSLGERLSIGARLSLFVSPAINILRVNHTWLKGNGMSVRCGQTALVFLLTWDHDNKQNKQQRKKGSYEGILIIF